MKLQARFNPSAHTAAEEQLWGHGRRCQLAFSHSRASPLSEEEILFSGRHREHREWEPDAVVAAHGLLVFAQMSTYKRSVPGLAIPKNSFPYRPANALLNLRIFETLPEASPGPRCGT